LRFDHLRHFQDLVARFRRCRLPCRQLAIIGELADPAGYPGSMNTERGDYEMDSACARAGGGVVFQLSFTHFRATRSRRLVSSRTWASPGACGLPGHLVPRRKSGRSTSETRPEPA